MTSLAGAMADADLGEYLGKRITNTTLVVKKTGDGLSESMEIAPEVLIPGSTVYVLMECEVAAHQHTLDTKHDCYELKQTLNAKTAIIVDDQNSQKKIAAQKNRLEKAQEAAKGIQRLEGTEDAIDGQDNVHPISGKDAAAGERPEPEWDDDPSND